MLADAVLLRLRAGGGGGLRGHGGHGDGGDLVDDVHRLHDGRGAGRGGDDGRRGHGVGHRLHGRLRQRAVHGDQDRLVAEGGACGVAVGGGGGKRLKEEGEFFFRLLAFPLPYQVSSV